MATETPGEFKYPLKTLIAGHGTTEYTDPLGYYGSRTGHGTVLPGSVFEDMAAYTRNLGEKEKVDPEEARAKLIEHFLDSCGSEGSLEVAASLIRWNNKGNYSLEFSGPMNGMPFNMDQEFQRDLLRASAVHEKDYWKGRVEKGLEPDASHAEGEIRKYEELIGKIDERIVSPPEPGHTL